MEANYKMEMEKKKAMLRQLADNAMHGVINGIGSNSFNEQSAAVGIGKVGNWLGRMIGEMENLSIAPMSAVAEATTSVRPVLNSIFTPTTACSANRNVLDPSLSSVLLGAPGSSNNVPPGPVPPVQLGRMESPLLPGYSQFEIDHLRQLGAFSISGQVPTISGFGNTNLTNVVTSCSTVPTASIPQTQPYVGLPVNSNIPRVEPVSFSAHHSLGERPPANLAPAPPVPYSMGPTQYQLLARQVMSRDLPPFRGDPEDWPLGGGGV